MPDQGRWRNSTAYDYISNLDPADLAWEFLRRNPEYRADYFRLKAEGHFDDAIEAALVDKC